MNARSVVLLIPMMAGSLASQDCDGTPLGLRQPVPGDVNVLFIGNSLTYVNNLPAIVAAMAHATGAPAIGHFAVAGPDMSLEDHWANGTALSVIGQYDWDYVVMQQGPSSLPENQLHLRTWAMQFGEEIRAVGATPAMYMVWPAHVNAGSFNAVVQSYTLAADAADAELLPAGSAWLAAWQIDPELPLYGADGFHPAPMGSYLAALVIYTRLTGFPVDDVPAHLPEVGIFLDEDDVAVLKQAAIEVTASLEPLARAASHTRSR